jgi:hypothetical protein
MPQFFSQPIVEDPGENLYADGTDDSPPDGYLQTDLGYTDDHALFPYLAQSLTVSYVGESGILQVAVGAPVVPGNPKIPCKLVRAFAPVMQKIVTYSYIRLGQIPTVPPPETTDPNLTLLRHLQMPLAAHELAVGQFAYGLSGQYVYALLTPLDTVDDKAFGRNPAYRADAVQSHFGAANFDASLQDG